MTCCARTLVIPIEFNIIVLHIVIVFILLFG
jgi:hypothetical protein